MIPLSVMSGKQVEPLAMQERNHGVAVPLSDRGGKWVPRLRFVRHKNGLRHYEHMIGRRAGLGPLPVEGGADHHGVSRYRLAMDKIRRPQLKKRRS